MSTTLGMARPFCVAPPRMARPSSKRTGGDGASSHSE
ncbi:hypothetical protein A2U01_0055373, partial [Trifolium medium]|nr:hypothetical protein [Trifolium medium]